jgi:hypothetical protein
MHTIRLTLISCLLAVGAGCTATPPLTPASNSVPECHRVCQEVGLEMTSLVVVGGLVGCVCELKHTPGAAPPAGAAAASATTVIIAQQQQQQQASAANRH